MLFGKAIKDIVGFVGINFIKSIDKQYKDVYISPVGLAV
jgi:hypothetical protein